MNARSAGRRAIGLICCTALVVAQSLGSFAWAEDTAAIATARAKAVAGAAERWAAEHLFTADDPDAVLRDVGKDPAALTQWVRGNTRLLIYGGVLRDWRGVLMDRAGNDLDRALLLAELLRRAGREVRIARADLQQDAVERLLAAASAPAPRAPVAAVTPDELAAAFGDDSGIEPDILADVSSAVAARRTKGLENARRTIAAVLPQVCAAVGGDESMGAGLRKSAEAALFDHHWVQVRDGNTWLSLDPNEEEAGPLTPQATFDPADVPDNLFYRVSFKVVLETWSQGSLNESALLTYEASPADLEWQPITLTHEPIPNPAGQAPANDPAALLQALRGSWVFVPTIVVNGKATTHKLFTTDGRVLPATSETLTKLGVGRDMGGTIGGAGQIGSDMLGGEQAPGPPDENASPVKVTAEYLDVQVTGPAGPSEVERRIVFDLLTPEERAEPETAKIGIGPLRQAKRNLALSGVADIVVFGADPAAGWVEARMVKGLAQMARAIAEGPKGNDPAAFEAAVSAPMERMAPVLWSWAANRATALVDSPAVSPVAPNVAVLWQVPKVGADGAPAVRVTFDIVANTAGHGAAFEAAVRQGVLDTALEALAIDPEQPTGNTALAHAADIAAGRGWVAIGTGAASAIDALDLSPGAKPLLARDLSRGYVVVVAPHPAQDGVTYWWRTDPNTGATIGMSAAGFGTAMAEWTLAQRVGWLSFCAFTSLGAAVVHGVTVGGVAMGVFCVAGGFGAAHGTGALIGKGVIELFIELLMIGGGNAHHE